MDSAVASAEPPNALPQIPGPKLASFTPTGHADIEFIEELGNRAENMDSFVWKVRINGEEPFYALKLFRFQSVGWLQETVGSYLTRPLKTPRLWVDYFEPFSCECRVYGRLEEECREDLAVRAYGYLLITPEQELEVGKRSRPANPSDEPDDDPFGRADERLFPDRPVHAIVKELVTDQDHFLPIHAAQMWNDLEDLHKIGILVRDITVGNYLGGKLIDFSRAWTVPHPSLEHIHPRDIRSQRQHDPHDLQECIVDFSLGNGWWDEVELPEALVASVLGENETDGYGADPRRYDWRKWEPDLDAADEFLEHDLFGPPYPGSEPWVSTLDA